MLLGRGDPQIIIYKFEQVFSDDRQMLLSGWSQGQKGPRSDVQGQEILYREAQSIMGNFHMGKWDPCGQTDTSEKNCLSATL